MNNRDASEKFKQADKLYRAKRYDEAIVVLDELNEAFPETRHVMFPRARCLAKLDRTTEAMYLLREVVDKYDYAPAAELLNYLSVLQTTPLESEPPIPPEEPDDGGLGEHPAEGDEHPASAATTEPTGFAPIPIPGAKAVPPARSIDSTELPELAGTPDLDMAPEFGLLDNLHGGDGLLPDIDPATVPIDDDLFGAAKPAAPPAPAEPERNANWILFVGIGVIAVAFIALCVAAVVLYEPPTPEEIAAAELASTPTPTAAPVPAAAPTAETPVPAPPPKPKVAFPGADSNEVIFPDQTWTMPQILAWDEARYEFTGEKQEEYAFKMRMMKDHERAVLDARLDMAYEWEWEQNKEEITAADVGAVAGIGIVAFIIIILVQIVFWVIFSLLWQPIPIYLTLVIRDKMPGGDFAHNIFQVIFCCVIMGVLMGVVRMGYFVGMAAIGKQFDWEAMDYLIYVLLSAVMAGVYVLIVMSILPPEVIDMFTQSPTGY